MITVAELEGYNPASGQVEIVRLTSGVHFTTASNHYAPSISGAFTFRHSVYSGTILEPSSTLGIGEITTINEGDFDDLHRWGFDGRPARLWRVQDEMVHTLPDVPDVLTTMRPPELDWGSITFVLENPLQRLDKPLQESVYEPITGDQYHNPDFNPDTYVDGDESLKDTTKPMLYGRCNNITMKLLNPYLLLYGCNYDRDGNFRAVHNFLFVGTGGVRYQFEQDFPDVDTLIAATPSPGHYISCLAAGLVRLGTDPKGSVTADVASAPDSQCSVADLVRQVLIDFGAIDDTNLDVLDSAEDLKTLCSLPAGVYITTDATALSVVSSLLSSINAWITCDSQGTYYFGWMKMPSELEGVTGPVLTADHWRKGQIKVASFSGETGVPAKSLSWGHARNWTPLSDGSVGVTVSSSRRGYLEAPYRYREIESGQDILNRHLQAETVSVDTLLNPSSQIYLDNETFEAGLFRWDAVGDVTEVDNTIFIDATYALGNYYVRQTVDLPAAAPGTYQVSVTVHGGSLVLAFPNPDASGSVFENLVPDDINTPQTFVFEMPLTTATTIAITVIATPGNMGFVHRVQVTDPGLALQAEAEAVRRHAQASAVVDAYEVSFPMDIVLDYGLGSEVRLQDYRYNLSSGPVFQVTGRLEDWENELITLTLVRIAG